MNNVPTFFVSKILPSVRIILSKYLVSYLKKYFYELTKMKVFYDQVNILFALK